MPRYFVRHETVYRYAQSVGLSRQLLRLEPRALPRQQLLAHRLEIAPTPEIQRARVDAFGNRVTELCIETEHAELDVLAESWVDVSPRRVPLDLGGTMAWDAARARLGYRAADPPNPEDLDATRFLFESKHVRHKRVFAAWADECFPVGAPLGACAARLMEKVHAELVYDPAATTVSTPVTEVFERRRGVCQDFAHLMISCFRSLGLPARYVSGYLLTVPAAGKPRLVGADASHAWVAVYVPDHGWLDLDPTNARIPNDEYVTLGWGRDFGDVTPLRGVLLGGGEQELDIAVTMAPIEDYPRLFGAPPPPLPPPHAALPEERSFEDQPVEH